MQYFLGVDIGTFSSKGVLTDGAGTIVAQASRAHQMIVPQPGWAEHCPDEDWWGDFVFITRSLLAQAAIDPADIGAIATSGIGPCMLPVDAAGAPLMNGVLYGVDTRAHAEIDILNREITTEVILARGGNALTSQSVGPKILWLKRNQPEIWARTTRIHTSTTYLTYRLTGATVIDHYTAASFSPLYDIVAQKWCSDLAGICTHDQLPRLLWSTEVAGHVTAAAAAETGLAPGTPVTCGTIDAAAEAVSVGTRDPGDMMLMYGSTIFIIQVVAKRLSHPALWHAPWLFPNQHAVMAGLATSGTLTHWFQEHLARDTTFQSLAAEAQAAPPGARNLLCLPYFSGERTPLHDPNAKGAFFGLNLTHRRADLARSVLEGIAMATRQITETFAEAGAAATKVLAVGGGTQNPLWLQTTSDITGLPQSVCSVTTGAAFGDAFLAAIAIGTARPADIARWNPLAATIVPEQHAVYDRLYPLFRRLYLQTRDIAAELGAVE